MANYFGTTTIKREANGIAETIIEYQQGSSGTTAPTGTWSATVPSVSSGKYLWTRKTTKYTNGEIDYEYSVGYKGTSGSSTYLLELSNDEDSVFVGTDKVLNTTEDLTLGTTEITLYKGSTPVTSNVTYGYEFGTEDMSGFVEVAMSANTATIKLKDGFNQPSSAVKFYAQLSGVKYYANYRIRLIADGKDGVSYKILTNISAIAKNSSGVIQLTSNLTAKVVESGSVLTNAEMSNAHLYLEVKAGSTTLKSKTATQVGVTATSIKNANPASITVNLYYNSTLIDTETIPVISDGTNGSTPTIGDDGFWYINGENTGIKAEGQDGEDGTSVKILGTYSSLSALNSAHPSGNTNGDGYIVGTHLYVWTGTAFTDVGQIKGSDGTTYYTHVAWMNALNNSDSSFTVSNPSGSAYNYLGTLVDTTKADSTDYTKYKWIHVKGADGIDGKDAVNMNPNVLHDSSFLFLSGASSASSSKWIKNAATLFANYYAEKSAYCSSTTSGLCLVNQPLSILNSKTYTLSFDVKSSSSVKGNYYVRINTTVNGTGSDSGGIDSTKGVIVDGVAVASPNNYELISGTATSEWVRHTITFTTKSSFLAQEYIAFSKSSNSNGTNIFFAHIKLEEGEDATAWCSAEADRKGEQGIQGMSGKTLRRRGSYNATTIGTTGDIIINVEGGFSDWITYTDGTNQGKFRLQDGVTEWTKTYYIKNGTKTTSLVKPTFSGTNAVWVKFNEMNDLAVGMLIAGSVHASSANIVEAFFGDAGSGVTQNEDGTLTIDSSANGWVIKGGEIRHTRTGLKLTSDGKLDSGEQLDALTLRANALRCLNLQNEKVMWLDDKGNLMTAGSVVNAVQEIDVTNNKNKHLLVSTNTSNYSNLISTTLPFTSTAKSYMLDVLRCGSVLILKNIDGHILLPYYYGSSNYRRTSTLFETGVEHLITEVEMRRMIGKRIVVYGTTSSYTNYLYCGGYPNGDSTYSMSDVTDDLVNGNSVIANFGGEQGFQINTNCAFMLEFALGYMNGGMVYYWKRVKFTSYGIDWDGDE